MNIQNYNIRTKQRTDTRANWEDINPILYNGEIGICTDIESDGTTTFKIKVGDGIHRWKDIPYITASYDSENFGYVTVEKSGRIATVQATNPNDGKVTTVYITDGKDGTNGTDGKDGIDGKDGFSPQIDSSTGNWIINGIVTSYSSKGEKGEKGDSFKIYAIYDSIATMLTHSEVEDGQLVVVEDGGRLFLKDSSHVDLDDPDYINGWLEIGDFSSITAIRGEKGDKGDPGITPIAQDVTLSDGTIEKHWFYDTTDSGIIAEGIKGDKGDSGSDGTDGKDGYSPQINFEESEDNGYSTIEYQYQDESGAIQKKTIYLDNGHYIDIDITKNDNFSTNTSEAVSKVKFSYIDGDGNKQSRTLDVLNGLKPLFYKYKSNEIYNIEDLKTITNDGYNIYINPTFDSNNIVKTYESVIIIRNPKMSVDNSIDGITKITVKNSDGTEQIVSVNTGWVPDFSFAQDDNNSNLYHLSIEDSKGVTHNADISSAEILISDKKDNYYEITANDGVNGKKTVKIFDGANAYDDTDIRNQLAAATYTDDSGAEITLGGWTVGDTASNMSFQEFAQKLLHPHNKPSVNLSINPSTRIYHNGDTINSLNLSAKVTKMSSNIVDVYFIVDTTKITPNEEIISETTTYTANYSSNITKDTTISVYAEDADGCKSFTSTAITFVDYVYCGFINGDIITPEIADITGLQRCELLSSYNYSYSADIDENSKIVFAYPASYGNLSNILNELGWDCISSYTKGNIVINSINYNYYILTEAIGAGKYTQKFS